MIFSLVKPTNIKMMWFKRNGHFAKNEKNESEVPYEFSKNKTTLHSRV